MSDDARKRTKEAVPGMCEFGGVRSAGSGVEPPGANDNEYVGGDGSLLSRAGCHRSRV
jgi:hypothetical protein